MKTAYILDLFGKKPRKARNWQRPYYVFTLFGLRMPIGEDAVRQNNLLRADTRPELTAPLTP